MQLDRKELLNQLDQVRPGLHEGGKTPQADCFLFKDGFVHTYNDEVLIRHPSLIDVTGAVKGEPLYQLLSKLNSDSLIFNETDGAFQFTTKKSHASLNADAEIQSPAFQIELPEKWKKLPEGFIEGVKFCIFSASRDMSRPALTCIHVEEDAIESCDNFRLTRYMLKGSVEKSLLFPAASAVLLSKYAVTSYGLTEGWTHFKAGDFTLSCRSFSEKYPDLDPLLKVDGVKVTLPKDLLGTLNRAGIFTSTEFRQDCILQVSFTPGKLTVKSQNANGWYREQVAMKYSGEPLSFNVNPEFLKEMLPLLDHVMIGAKSLLMEGENFVHLVTLMRDTEEK